MILTMLLAVTAAGSVPLPINAEDWIKDTDWPRAALVAGHGGTVVVNLTINEIGRPAHCDVTRASGVTQLDERSCAVLMKRARFLPAHDESGNAVASVVTRQIGWSINSPISMAIPADMTVNVKELPPGMSSKVVAVRQVIGADGAVASCVVDSGSISPAFDRLACSQATELATLGPAKDAGGAPIRTLRPLRIVFAAPF
jgi:TonB family protein